MPRAAMSLCEEDSPLPLNFPVLLLGHTARVSTWHTAEGLAALMTHPDWASTLLP